VTGKPQRHLASSEEPAKAVARSAHFFSLCVDRVVREWKRTAGNGVQMAFGKVTETVLCADGRVTVPKPQDELQTATDELKKVGNKYDIKIS
jgi:hypothetical protein